MDLKRERFKAAKKYGLEMEQELDAQIDKEAVKHPPRKEMDKKDAFFGILKEMMRFFLTPFRRK